MVVTAYENIWTALVPEGYVVALPTTGGELFPNHGDFGADLAFVVEKLRAENSNPASFLHQKLSGKAAVMGHSMGGGASFIAADVNPTVDGIAVLAPAETNPSAIGAAAGITVPTLVFSGTKDCVASASQHQLPMYDASASTCKTYVSVAGGSHCQFGINNTLCNLGELFCGGAGISRAAQHAIVSSLLLPWLDGVLRSDWQRWQDFEATLAAGSGFTSQRSCPVSPAPVPACTNGVDDDGDGAIDAADAGCNLSQLGVENPQCQDGIDNDGDGAIDFPTDTLCQGAWDPDESTNPASCGLLGPELLLVLAALRLRSRAKR
jgi:dienelactone hydrolase